MSDNLDYRQLTYPNKMSRIMLMAMRDVMGANGINAVLNTARLSHLIDAYPPLDFGPGLNFGEVGQIMEAVEGIYGVQGGQHLLRQAGHACFTHGVEGFGVVLGFADVVLRLLPVSLRAQIGLEVLAEILTRYSSHRVVLGEGTDSLFFVLEPCGFCAGRSAETPVCSLGVGLVEEMLYWVTHGRRFRVEETTCVACGDPVCTLCIAKQPLDQG